MNKASCRSYLAPNRYERVLNRHLWASPLTRAAFAGSSRAARLSFKGQDDGQQRIIWDTAANVIGPLYVSFVWHILKDAHQKGTGRLYFMARDGLILKEIADILAPVLGINIENRYIYVSRQSLLYPSIMSMDAFDLRWMMWTPVMPVHARTVLDRLDIDASVVNEELLRHGITDPDAMMTWVQKWHFRDFLKEPHVKAMVLERAQARYAQTIAYLRQEGMTDGIPFAMVDLGWAALSQYALSRILHKDGAYPSGGVQGYYLGTNWLLWEYRNDKADSFLFNPSNLMARMPSVQYELLEIFATADHGRTLGYEKQDNRMVPVLGKPDIAAQQWGGDLQRAGVLAFAREVVRVLPKKYWCEDVPKASVGKVFDLFCNAPTLNEAKVYGKFLHGADIEEKGRQEIAPRVGLAGLFRILKGYYWVQGSVVRSRFFLAGILNKGIVVLNIIRHWIVALVDGVFFNGKTVERN